MWLSTSHCGPRSSGPSGSGWPSSWLVAPSSWSASTPTRSSGDAFSRKRVRGASEVDRAPPHTGFFMTAVDPPRPRRDASGGRSFAKLASLAW